MTAGVLTVKMTLVTWSAEIAAMLEVIVQNLRNSGISRDIFPSRARPQQKSGSSERVLRDMPITYPNEDLPKLERPRGHP